MRLEGLTTSDSGFGDRVYGVGLWVAASHAEVRVLGYRVSGCTVTRLRTVSGLGSAWGC